MLRSTPVDGFSLAYERAGSGHAVVALHGWPGDHRDYRALAPLLAGIAEVLTPDLRGFGESDRHPRPPQEAYSALAQAAGVAGLIEELGLRRPVLVGYDVGSRVAQALARERPELIGAIVVTPPLPGVGEQVLSPSAQRQFWYQAFHQLELADELIDGNPEAVRRYLSHFWSHWSGPGFELPAAELDRLVELYAAPGAFSASIAWYRAGSGTVRISIDELEHPPAPITVPTTALWPGRDPLFPRDWRSGASAFFEAITLRELPEVGHFVPLEAPAELAAAVEIAIRGAQLSD